MSEKKPQYTFDSIIKELREGKFAPIYVLMGEESYYIDAISDYIQNNILSPEQQAFDQNIVFGADVSVSQIMDMSMQYPMMSAVRVVIVKEAQGLKSIERLDKYLDNPQVKTILVICYKNGTINRRTKLIAKAEQTGVVFDSKKMKDWQVPAYIKTYLSKHNVRIDDKSASMIADSIGGNLHKLHSELSKLLIMTPNEDRVVTPDIVERHIGVSKDFNAFELRNAIVNKDIFKANQIVKYFNRNPRAGSVFSFLPLLFSYFQNLLLAYYAPNRNDKDEVCKFLELKSVWGVNDYMVGMRNYTGRKTLEILRKLRDIDAKSKGIHNPNTSPDELLRELIHFILH